MCFTRSLLTLAQRWEQMFVFTLNMKDGALHEMEMVFVNVFQSSQSNATKENSLTK